MIYSTHTILIGENNPFRYEGRGKKPSTSRYHLEFSFQTGNVCPLLGRRLRSLSTQTGADCPFYTDALHTMQGWGWLVREEEEMVSVGCLDLITFKRKNRDFICKNLVRRLMILRTLAGLLLFILCFLSVDSMQWDEISLEWWRI